MEFGGIDLQREKLKKVLIGMIVIVIFCIAVATFALRPCINLEDVNFYGILLPLVVMIYVDLIMILFVLSAYLKENKPKLSKVLFWLAIYVIVLSVGILIYTFCKVY